MQEEAESPLRGYELAKKWPKKSAVKMGIKGLSFPRASQIGRAAPTYVPFFCDVFITSPLDTYFRGEGSSLEQAELDAWRQYEKYVACKNHIFEPRGQTNGSNFCKNCDLFRSSTQDI